MALSVISDRSTAFAPWTLVAAARGPFLPPIVREPDCLLRVDALGRRFVERMPHHHERHLLPRRDGKVCRRRQVLAAHRHVGVEQQAVGPATALMPPGMRRTQGTIEP